MSAILPPSERVWWKQPLDRVELLWILIAPITYSSNHRYNGRIAQFSKRGAH